MGYNRELVENLPGAALSGPVFYVAVGRTDQPFRHDFLKALGGLEGTRLLSARLPAHDSLAATRGMIAFRPLRPDVQGNQWDHLPSLTILQAVTPLLAAPRDQPWHVHVHVGIDAPDDWRLLDACHEGWHAVADGKCLPRAWVVKTADEVSEWFLCRENLLAPTEVL